MSKTKNVEKPIQKRDENYRGCISMDEMARLLDQTEAKLSDVTKDRDLWISEFNMWRTAWLREMGGVIVRKAHEIDGFVLRTRDIFEKSKKADRLQADYRQMCEYRDQWAAQSAVWEQTATDLETRVAWEQDLASMALGKWVDREIMLDAVCKALGIAQSGVAWWMGEHAVMRLIYNQKCDELVLAKRNIFSKLWHWFVDPPRDLGRDI